MTHPLVSHSQSFTPRLPRVPHHSGLLLLLFRGSGGCLHATHPLISPPSASTPPLISPPSASTHPNVSTHPSCHTCPSVSTCPSVVVSTCPSIIEIVTHPSVLRPDVHVQASPVLRVVATRSRGRGPSPLIGGKQQQQQQQRQQQ